MTAAHGVQVVSDWTQPAEQVAAILNRGHHDDPRARVDGDHTVVSWAIVEGCDTPADAEAWAVADLRAMPGCIHADTWPPDRTEVGP